MKRRAAFALMLGLACSRTDTYFLQHTYTELLRGVYWSTALRGAQLLEGSIYLKPMAVDTFRMDSLMREHIPTYETYVDAGSLRGLAQALGAQAVVVPEMVKIAVGHRGNDPSQPAYCETTLLLKVYGFPEAKLLYSARARGLAWEAVEGSVHQALERALGLFLGQ